MATDWVARGLGIAGAVSGFLALGWSVISWHREGPVLKASAAYAYGQGGEVEISGHVANRGRLQTTIAKLAVEYSSPQRFIDGRFLVVNTLERGFRFLLSTEVRGLTLDQPMLPQTGSAYVISLADAEDLRESLDNRQGVWVQFWTATNQSIDVKVKYHRNWLPRFMRDL